MHFQLVETLKAKCFQPGVNLMCCSTCTSALPRGSDEVEGARGAGVRALVRVHGAGEARVRGARGGPPGTLFAQPQPQHRARAVEAQVDI